MQVFYKKQTEALCFGQITMSEVFVVLLSQTALALHFGPLWFTYTIFFTITNAKYSEFQTASFNHK
jgi:hypothetical protein